MAHCTNEREDLLRDAVALAPRVRLRAKLGTQDVQVFAGFRGEALSVYFDGDPAYHFNAHGDLRRAFLVNRLVKAQDGRLIAMDRVHTSQTVQLQAHEMADVEARQTLDDLADRLAALRAALATGSPVVEGQIPEDGNAVERLTAWLDQHPRPGIASSPRIAD